MQSISAIPIITSVIGGLILFLYSIRKLSLILQRIFTSHSKKIIERFTKNIFSSILIGTLITILLGSSSAVIIITIVFINSGSLNFRQAMGIIMGSNFGTTFSSQLIALNISFYAVIILTIGFLIWMISKSKRNRKSNNNSLSQKKVLEVMLLGPFFVKEVIEYQMLKYFIW